MASSRLGVCCVFLQVPKCFTDCLPEFLILAANKCQRGGVKDDRLHATEYVLNLRHPQEARPGACSFPSAGMGADWSPTARL